MIRSGLSSFLSLVTLAVPAVHAQQPSNWSTISLPPGASAFNAIGTTATFRTPTEVWLYSGVTKKWTVLPVGPLASVFQANDYCIVRDGAFFHGFASHTGEVDTVKITGPVTVVSGSASSSWVTLVSSGRTVHGFGGFSGKWTSATLGHDNPTMVANRLIGLVYDGSEVFALSAHHGTFVSTLGGPNVTLNVVGEAEVGTANSPGWFRAFSAQQNTWVTQAVPTGAATFQSNEYALAWSGNQIWGCSGLRGNLTTYVASGPITSVTGAEGVAAFVDGSAVVCYGAGRGEFVARAAVAPTFVHKYHYTLVQDSGLLTPFSAVTGEFGPTITGTFTAVTNDAIAWVTAGATSFAYSPILNDWFAPPPITILGTTVVRDSVVLREAGGFVALSARHGTWVSQATTTATFQAPTTGSTFLSIDGANNETLHVFDARLNRWATVTGLGAMTVKISRHTAMAHDGINGYGFGQPSGEWFVEPLTGLPQAFDTASSIGTLRHGTSLSVYSVQGSFSYTGRYPEFTQAINLGNTLRMHQLADPGSLLVQLFGFAPAYVAVPSFGTLYVDPTGMAITPWPALVDADGFLEMELPLPNDPSLVGEQIHLQNLVVPPTGPWWLSSSVAPILF